jgi:hypothetical protein
MQSSPSGFIEWLLSTLFDASLLDLKSREFAAPFFCSSFGAQIAPQDSNS